MSARLKVFELGVSTGKWSAKQIIAATSVEQANKIARWDYNDQTAYCRELVDVSATGAPRVLFSCPGD